VSFHQARQNEGTPFAPPGRGAVLAEEPMYRTIEERRDAKRVWLALALIISIVIGFTFYVWGS
jgi:hypothetical protein